MPTIRPACAGDIGPAADTIATAFNGLRAAHWLVQDEARRQPVLAADFWILVEHALMHGVVDVIDDGPTAAGTQPAIDARFRRGDGPAAVAVWFDHTDGTPPEPSDYDLRLEAATGHDADRFRLLDDLFAEHHPAGPPHYHLALLAVDPFYQGLGLGTALLNRHHTRQPDTAAYLEASSPSSRDLYLRFGYQVHKTISLPDRTKFWLMWRPATTRVGAVA